MGLQNETQYHNSSISSKILQKKTGSLDGGLLTSKKKKKKRNNNNKKKTLEVLSLYTGNRIAENCELTVN